MRTSFALTVLTLALPLAIACGGDDSSPADAGTHDAAVTQDLHVSNDQAVTVAHDLAGADLKGVSCGSSTCGSGSVCCVAVDFDTQTLMSMCMAGTTCPGDGGITTSCDGPEDCSSMTCCANFVIGSGSAGGQAACQTDCPPSFAKSGSDTDVQTKLCHQPSDCANYSSSGTPYDLCCTYPGVGYYFCAPEIAPLLSSSVTCL